MQIQIMQTTIDLGKYIHLSSRLRLIMQLHHRYTANKGKEGHSLMVLVMLFRVGEFCREVIWWIHKFQFLEIIIWLLLVHKFH